MKNYNEEDFVLNINSFGEIKDIKLLKLKKMRFFSSVSRHSKIQIGFIFEEKNVKKLNMAVKDIKTEILAGFKNKKDVYYFFEGYISSIKITKITDKLFSCKLYGISKTIDLDTKYTNKIYQNSDYRSFYEDLKKETDRIYINSEILKDKLNSIVVRYKETPWRICKRMASYKETVLYPRLSNVMFGKSNTVTEYTLDKNFSFIKESVIRNNFNIYLNLFIETKELFLIGDKINILENENEKSFIVNGSCINFRDRKVKTCKYKNGGDFSLKYLLVSENWKYKHKIYNKELRGLVLHGKVFENNMDSGVASIKVDFYEDLAPKYNAAGDKYERVEKYYNIPYITPYSKNKTGLFAAPETGDNILLGFKNEADESIYTLGSMYNEKDDRFVNNKYRNYFTNGSKIELDAIESRLALEANEKYTEKSAALKLLADNITIKTKKFDGLL